MHRRRNQSYLYFSKILICFISLLLSFQGVLVESHFWGRGRGRKGGGAGGGKILDDAKVRIQTFSNLFSKRSVLEMSKGKT